jgi:L-2-hydroxyglutarate oxidase LhgO
MRRIRIEEADNGYIVTVTEDTLDNNQTHADFVFVGTGDYADRIGRFVEKAIDADMLDDNGIDELLEASYAGQHAYD